MNNNILADWFDEDLHSMLDVLEILSALKVVAPEDVLLFAGLMVMREEMMQGEY